MTGYTKQFICISLSTLLFFLTGCGNATQSLSNGQNSSHSSETDVAQYSALNTTKEENQKASESEDLEQQHTDYGNDHTTDASECANEENVILEDNYYFTKHFGIVDNNGLLIGDYSTEEINEIFFDNNSPLYTGRSNHREGWNTLL